MREWVGGWLPSLTVAAHMIHIWQYSYNYNYHMNLCMYIICVYVCVSLSTKGSQVSITLLFVLWAT